MSRRHSNPEKNKREVSSLTGVLIKNVPDALVQVDIYVPEVFKKITNREDLIKFCVDFEVWNKNVPWLVYANSQPHKDLMRRLTFLMRDKTGESCVDLGCGYGEFLTHALQLGDCRIRKYFAVDLDWNTLAAIPKNLKHTVFCDSDSKKIFLIRATFMFRTPIKDGSVDSVISSLGALMYAWAWFDQNGNQVAFGRDAFVQGLKEIHRIVKPGGYLGISAPLPNPNWATIKRQALKYLIFHEFSFRKPVSSLKRIITSARHGHRAVRYSKFMNNLEQEGKAHFLTLAEWDEYLSQTGFEIIAYDDDCYAKQGIIVIAQKI